MCQRVLMTRMPPPGASRVYSVEVYHSHTLRRMVGLSASARSLNGSSMMRMSPPMPVMPPPTPALR